MKILMISLDKNILNENSAAAKRMISYGAQNDLFVIIPDNAKKEISLSENVKVYATGGNKLQQFFRLKKIGKEILQKNKINLITTQDPFFTGLIGTCLKRKFKVNLEVQLHGDFFSSDYYKKSGCKNWLQYYIAKLLVIKKADKIRVVGDRIKKSLLDMGIDESKIERRPVPLDSNWLDGYKPDKMFLRKKYPGYEKIFLSIGRLEKVKNIDFLIDVFVEVIKEKKNFLLLIVGKGSEKTRLQEKVKTSGLENNIKFEDWTQQPMNFIGAVDCVLFPSLSEGYGLVPMEVHESVKLIMSDVGVANFELKPSEKVKILQLDKNIWVKEILKYE